MGNDPITKLLNEVKEANNDNKSKNNQKKKNSKHSVV